MGAHSKNRLTIVLAAGGTGGHMIPAEAVADALSARGHNLILVTDPRGDAYPAIMDNYERTVLKTNGMSAGLLGKVKGAFSLARDTIACRQFLKKVKADVVIGFGGYPSMPTVVAAKSCGIPYILHEQNTVLGRVNRLMAKSSEAIALAYENTWRIPENVEYFVTGNPVRKQVLDSLSHGYSLPRSGETFNVLIMGGSQGAHILSKVVPNAIAALVEADRKRLKVVHQARVEDIELVSNIYEQAGVSATVESYFVDIPQRMATSQLVISRAGASSLAEISVLGLPSFLVPLKIAMDDHQTTNAAVLSEAGAAVVFREEEFTVESVKENITQLLSDGSKRLQAMSKAAQSCGSEHSALVLADLIEKVCKRS
ncbi:undecaprenyldiphospho-muramoylpentapeptide beta-N-acetylglucosaminyltransferase [Temperatibacter marinus]|uniref:UDP-N-acetylglucosamine--N-acetylmuramyl-(pentapeptide) pyrophosphoryl-undecaprenol N-acetylglucosamine transferase n=1 Tax=Temperatibacter marinus TaxID=1456591 RepID=A0AA52EFI9_9PROT|nr:undecaprenyldiphospho-muramoylpentapeptide beta-N-acetylglucosaminyltransferase [Temperatibacter marinus]WND01594.1 undecaprenyldiphospho-muramoylpentapeptide beta-N-acetylglucosaminyltransferase [Temperatibacter marinus]